MARNRAAGKAKMHEIVSAIKSREIAAKPPKTRKSKPRKAPKLRQDTVGRRKKTATAMQKELERLENRPLWPEGSTPPDPDLTDLIKEHGAPTGSTDFEFRYISHGVQFTDGFYASWLRRDNERDWERVEGSMGAAE